MIRESNTTKKNKNNFKPWMRSPKTKGEKTKAADAEDQGVTVRGKRKPTNLPDDWDDDFVSNVGKKSNKGKKPERKTIRKEEDEQSVYKQMKKNNGKMTFSVPEAKPRRHFAPGTKTEKPAKGKGSYDRKNAFDEDEEKKACWKGYEKKGTKKKGDKTVNNCVKESVSISKFIEAIMTKNHAQAHKQLKSAVNGKIQKRIAQEIDKPLF